VDALLEGVSHAVLENARSRERIQALEQVSRRIDKIVDAITTVSVQTNMLAVNGSIEAARAGEFGRGFMVVSTDIRNLARESSENAERIKDLVRGIQDQIAHVRRNLEEIAAAGSAEMEKNKVLAQRLGTVADDTDAVLAASDTLLGAAKTTKSALAEARHGVEQMASAAQEADQATTEAAKAMREQSKGIDELSASVDAIAALADDLQSAA
jgi:methyl-accepting chemotaxis protein